MSSLIVSILLSLLLSTASYASGSLCLDLFSNSFASKSISDWYSFSPLESGLTEKRPKDKSIKADHNALEPKYVRSNITPQKGLFRLGNLFIPNQFYMVIREKLKLGEESLTQDLQPCYETDSLESSLVYRNSGGSNAIKSYFKNYYLSIGEKVQLVRLLSKWEKNIWINCKLFQKNPSQSQLMNLINSDLKESSEFVQNFLNKDISKKDVEAILNSILNIIGRERNFGRMFLGPKRQMLSQFHDSEWVGFQIDPKIDMFTWFFGVEPNYIEILVPRDLSRISLLDGLILDPFDG